MWYRKRSAKPISSRILLVFRWLASQFPWLPFSPSMMPWSLLHSIPFAKRTTRVGRMQSKQLPMLRSVTWKQTMSVPFSKQRTNRKRTYASVVGTAYSHKVYFLMLLDHMQICKRKAQSVQHSSTRRPTRSMTIYWGFCSYRFNKIIWIFVSSLPCGGKISCSPMDYLCLKYLLTDLIGVSASGPWAVPLFGTSLTVLSLTVASTEEIDSTEALIRLIMELLAWFPHVWVS